MSDQSNKANKPENLDRVIDRIKKMLALAADKSNEHEAATAAAQAAKTMRHYNISMAEVIAADLKRNSDLITSEQFSDVEYKTGIPQWLQSLSIYVAECFDCKIRIGFKGDGKTRFLKIYGYKSDIEVARYVMIFLIGRINHLAWEKWEQNYKYYESLGYRNVSWKREYMLGLAVGVQDRLQELYKKDPDASAGTALVVLKSQMIEQKFGVIKYGSSDGELGDAYYKGLKDSDKIQLNKGVGADANNAEQLN